MERAFDKLSKALSRKISRRDALKWVTAGAAGTALTTLNEQPALATETV